MEMPSPGAGVVKEVRIKVGDKVSQGTLILELDARDEPKKAESKKQEPVPQATPAPAAAPPRSGPGPQPVPRPDIGDFKEAELIEALGRPDGRVEKGQELLTFAPAKGRMESP